jgi:polysaccharide export outer membrane protein
MQALVMAGLLSACAGQRLGSMAVPAAGAGGEVGAPGAVAALRAPVSALVQPGDVVRMAIWREPDLSGDFRVDETGVVVLPKLGAQQIGQESGEAFRTRIVAEYRRFLRNPSIDVVFLRRIPISGAVRNPGLYNVDLTVSVSDALALAGGVTEQGNPDRVYVVRERIGSRVVAERGAAIATLALGSGDRLHVAQRSWLSRNAGVAAGIASSLTGLLIIIASQ